jgi:hypothetical protein
MSWSHAWVESALIFSPVTDGHVIQISKAPAFVPRAPHASRTNNNDELAAQVPARFSFKRAQADAVFRLRVALVGNGQFLP